MTPDDRNQYQPGQPRKDRSQSRPGGSGRAGGSGRPGGPGRPDVPGRSPAGSPGRPGPGSRPSRGDSRPGPGSRLDHEGQVSRTGGGDRFNRTERAPKAAFSERSHLEASPDRLRTEDDEPLPADRLEGRNPILEAIKAGRPINKLYVLKLKDKPDPTLARIVREAREGGAVIMEVERPVLDQMSVTTGHQGVIAHVAMHEYAELDDILATAREAGEAPFLIVLDELKESYNLGSVLRIADAAGAHGVLIPKRRSVGLDAAVAKASAGAIEHVPVVRVNNLTQTVEELKEKGFWIAAADEDATTDYHDIDWKGPMALIVGSEGEGIGQQLRKHCDFLIAIPQRGKVNSLNAAVATGIVVFEAMNQRHRAKK